MWEQIFSGLAALAVTLYVGLMAWDIVRFLTIGKGIAKMEDELELEGLNYRYRKACEEKLSALKSDLSRIKFRVHFHLAVMVILGVAVVVQGVLEG